ncbi:MAG: hypothetical protein NDF55_02995 [archaeon GB-1867-005]|nr:hypothetical protein [Candidatus Culexmicrobium cathedralense]
MGRYSSLSGVLMDKGLAELGDSLVNFLYSAAKSRVLGKFCGERVSNRILAEALRRAGLRAELPRRVDVQARGDAAEALVAYAWISKIVGIDEAIELLASKLKCMLDEGEFEASINAFAELLKLIWERFK